MIKNCNFMFYLKNTAFKKSIKIIFSTASTREKPANMLLTEAAVNSSGL